MNNYRVNPDPDLGLAKPGKGSPIRKRSVQIGGKKTSVSLEDWCWDAFKMIAKRRGCSINKLVSDVAARPRTRKLSQELREFAWDNL